MKRLFILVYIFLAIPVVWAQVPDELLKESTSNAIVVSSHEEFIIESAERSVIKKTYELVLKNKYASDLKEVWLYYDQFRESDTCRSADYGPERKGNCEIQTQRF